MNWEIVLVAILPNLISDLKVDASIDDVRKIALLYHLINWHPFLDNALISPPSRWRHWSKLLTTYWSSVCWLYQLLIKVVHARWFASCIDCESVSNIFFFLRAILLYNLFIANGVASEVFNKETLMAFKKCLCEKWYDSLILYQVNHIKLIKQLFSCFVKLF